MTIKNTDRAELITLIKELINEPDTNKEILKPVVQEMMAEYATTRDRALIKNMVKEVLKEDKSLLKDAIRELMAEEQSADSPEEKRRKEVRASIREDFDKYDAVFRALA